MNGLPEKQALRKVIAIIRKWAKTDNTEESFEPEKSGLDIDLIQKAGNWTFVFEYKSNGAVASVTNAIEKLKSNLGKIEEKAIPVVAVPFMGEAGREICAEKNVSWLDLSGNAHINAPGLVIHIEGKPNQFKSAGRPKDIFAPKSSRISRHLLIEPGRFITQRELTQETSLDEGLVSRVVREMEKSGLLTRNAAGAVRPKDPNILLDAWYEKYAFSKHRIIKGFVAERSSSLALKKLTQALKDNDLSYAATGLSAAWLLSQFATYRTSTVYVSEEPSDDLLKELNFVKEEKGSNFWLVVPNDEGVFDGALERETIRCVHPVQIYLDLKGHPERAKESAKELRSEYLTWSENAD